MIKKIYNFYKSRGFIVTFNQIIKSILVRVGLTVKLHPRKMVSNLSKAKKIFSGRTLEYNANGFWHVKPMPTEKELNEYYKLSYWGSFQPLSYGLGLRDIRHYTILIKLNPNFNNTKKKILNFGAGHGGLSIILNILGHDVINIEPSEMVDLFEKNWKSFSTIDHLKEEKFDLIYGSHSLEHINDLDYFNKKIKTVAKDETIFFWEVPNADHSECGPKENRIDIPHTYYFRKEYFKSIYSRINLLDCYNSRSADKLSPFEFKDSFQEGGDSLIVLARY